MQTHRGSLRQSGRWSKSHLSGGREWAVGLSLRGSWASAQTKKAELTWNPHHLGLVSTDGTAEAATRASTGRVVRDGRHVLQLAGCAEGVQRQGRGLSLGLAKNSRPRCGYVLRRRCCGRAKRRREEGQEGTRHTHFLPSAQETKGECRRQRPEKPCWNRWKSRRNLPLSEPS
jgi:hypothetical protein